MLTNKLQNVYTYALVWKKTGLHAKFQVHRCFDMDLVCIIMYCQDSAITKEVKGLTNNLCTSSEENWFTCKIQVHRCFDMDLVCIVMYCQDT